LRGRMVPPARAGKIAACSDACSVSSSPRSRPASR
jgi:hypothetical protein